MPNDGNYEEDPILGWIPSTPEPFWIRNWTTWWHWRPACYNCQIVFHDRDEHDLHWATTHQP